MHVRPWWLIGPLGMVLILTMSPAPGAIRPGLAHAPPPTRSGAQVARRPAAEDHRAAGSRPVSGDRTGGESIHLNFRQVDILQMITLMSELTGKNFLVDDKVRGKVTLIAPRPVTPAEAYQIFLAALKLQGFTVVPQGPINTVVPLRDVPGQPLPTVIAPAPSHP